MRIPETALAALFLVPLCAAPALSQESPLRGHWQPWQMRTGELANPAPVALVVHQHVIALESSVPWVRVHFARALLEKGSAVRVTSLLDGEVQTLDQVQLEQWRYGTAFFNGSLVLVELVAGPGTSKNSLEIDKVWAGDPPGLPPAGPDDICGGIDNRVPSNHRAVGRLVTSGYSSVGGCTGWIISQPAAGADKVHLSAGHCDRTDSVLSVMQFDVPASNANCSIVHPSTDKQFAVDTLMATIVDSGPGDDYAVFRCHPNPNTGLTTYQTQNAAITLASALPSTGTSLQVIGFGTDGTSGNNTGGGNATNCNCNPASNTGQRNFVQQQDTGPYFGAIGTKARFVADICRASSGGPVIQASNSQAIAIATHGGCPYSSYQSNSGTAVTHPGLQSAIQAAASLFPANDECSGALPVMDGATSHLSNWRASSSSPAWPCGSGGSDVWYSYRATCTGNITVDTCASPHGFDTVLEVFRGSCGSLVSLGCNDDGCSNSLSSLSVPVTNGATYYIRVGGYNGRQGDFDLNISGCPADNCLGSPALHLGFNGPFSTLSATTSFPTWPCGQGNNDVWFRYTPPNLGTLVVDTCSSSTNFDTVVEILDGNCIPSSSLVSLACGDDFPSCVHGTRQSFASASVTGGTTYHIRVGGYQGARGSFGLNLNFVQVNDTCQGALAIADGVNGPYSNVGATGGPLSCEGGSASDVWFAYFPTRSGRLTVDTCSGTRNFDTVMELLTGTCGLAGIRDCNDDYCGTGSSVSDLVTAGATYYVRVAGFNGQTGIFDLNVKLVPPSDECANAIPLAVGANGPFDSSGATDSAPAWACSSGGSDLWFSFSSPCSTWVTFDTCSAATTFDTVLEVFEGACNGPSIGCNDDACGLQSSLLVGLDAGRTYYVRVGGYNGRQGSFDLNVTFGTGAGTFQALPTGCGAAGITPGGTPSITQTITFTLSNLAGTPLMWIGLPVNVPLCPPAACVLGADLMFTFSVPAMSVPIPCDPLLIGGQLGVQGADVLVPGGCNNLFTVTDTILVTIG